jgi:hypothetical protein
MCDTVISAGEEQFSSCEEFHSEAIAELGKKVYQTLLKVEETLELADESDHPSGRFVPDVVTKYFGDNGAIETAERLERALKHLADGVCTDYELVCPVTGQMYVAHINYANLTTIKKYFDTMFKNMKPTTEEEYRKLLKETDPRSDALSLFGGLFERI